MTPDTKRRGATFQDLITVVERLRDPDGCPWDREQTHQSLAPLLLEECYEALDAIDAGDGDALAEELGDLLTHVAFHADVARRAGTFSADDLLGRVVEKLKRRHPHVFGEGARLDSAAEAWSQWDSIKRGERGEEASIIAGVSTAMPSLALATTLQKRAARAGLEPGRPHDAAGGSMPAGDGPVNEERAIGEALFGLARAASLAGVDPELALRRAALRFRARVLRAEAAAGGPIERLAPAERRRLWAAAADQD